MREDHHEASLEAHAHAHARARIALTACSKAAWQSIVLRRYTAPAVIEEFAVPASADQVIVLVAGGCFDIESRSAGRWQGTRYRVGSLGMTAPRHEAVLRWRGKKLNETLHLHRPRRRSTAWPPISRASIRRGSAC
jgi:hypothetical protein